MNILKAVAKPFTAMAGKVDSTVKQRALMSIARKAALLLAAWLVQQGWLDMNRVAEFAGYAVGLVSLFSGVQNAVNQG